MTHLLNNSNCKAAKLLVLTIYVLCSETFRGNIDTPSIFEGYENLSNGDIVGQELLYLQHEWLAVASKDGLDTLVKAIKKYDNERFPNLIVLLKIMQISYHFCRIQA